MTETTPSGVMNTGTGPQPGAPGTVVDPNTPPDLSVDPNGDPKGLVEQANRMIAWLQAQQNRVLGEVQSSAQALADVQQSDYPDPNALAAARDRYAKASAAWQQNLQAIQTWSDNQRAAYQLVQSASGKALTPEQRDLARAQAAEQNALAKKAQADAALAADPLNQALQRDKLTADADAQRLQNQWQQIQNANAQATAPYVGPTAAANSATAQANATTAQANAAVAPQAAQASLTKLVADGTLTQAQADQINAGLAAGDPAARVALLNAQTNETNTAAGATAAKLPVEIDQIKAQTAATQAGTAATTTLLPGQVAQQGATLANTQANTAALQAQTQATQLKLQQDRAGEIATLEDQLHTAIANRSMTPEQATEIYYQKVYGGDQFQRVKEANANALALNDSLLREHAYVPVTPGGYIPGYEPGGALQQNFRNMPHPLAMPSFQMHPQAFPQYAQSIGVNLSPGQGLPTGTAFDAQGNLLPGAQAQAPQYASSLTPITIPADQYYAQNPHLAAAHGLTPAPAVPVAATPPPAVNPYAGPPVSGKYGVRPAA